MLTLCFFFSFHHPILVDIIFSVFSLELLGTLLAQLLDISSSNAISSSLHSCIAMFQLLSALLFRLLLEFYFNIFSFHLHSILNNHPLLFSSELHISINRFVKLLFPIYL